MMNILELRWTLRPGRAHANGARSTERRFLDFIVDGTPLAQLLGVGKPTTDAQSGTVGDYCTILTLFPNSDAFPSGVRALLLEQPSDIGGERQQLYVCTECGDLYCGAESAVVERVGDAYIWRDFALQNAPMEDLEAHPDVFVFKSIPGVGSFRFEAKAYEAALRSALLDTGPIGD